jgi:tetratricopeptide (TPR) repeat protein
MSGDEGYRAVLADCERALGRPEVALRLVREALDQGPEAEETTELRLVEAGARADMGEVPAALLVLETAFGGRPRLETLDLADDDVRRLAAAYADLLSASGSPEAEHWQEAVAAADPEDEDVEFGEEELLLDESPLAPSSEDVEDSEDSEDSGEELVTGDVLPADGEERVDTTVARIPLEDDLLDLPGTSDADIEAEVAELLGEADEDTGADTGGDAAGGTEPLPER